MLSAFKRGNILRIALRAAGRSGANCWLPSSMTDEKPLRWPSSCRYFISSSACTPMPIATIHLAIKRRNLLLCGKHDIQARLNQARSKTLRERRLQGEQDFNVLCNVGRANNWNAEV